MDRTLQVHPTALFVLSQLQVAGFEAYLVGGAVRDLLLSADHVITTLQDYDFTTTATPEQIQAIFPNSFYENQFGTVSITFSHLLEQMGLLSADTFVTSTESAPPTRPSTRLIDVAQATKLHESLQKQHQGEDKKAVTTTPNQTSTSTFPNFEITTFRSDGAYEDHRRPTMVTWGQSLEEDLERRDFTINAMALSIPQDTLLTYLESHSSGNPLLPLTIHQGDYHLVDPHQGQRDLEQHVIRSVGDPHRRFQEDALRMLRAVRFSVQLGMTIDAETFAAIIAHHELLTHISQERIGAEMIKIFGSPYPAEGILTLDKVHLLSHILPELLACKDVEQGGHHTTDVWTHSLDALRECPSADPIVRLATLLHDIAKPQTFGRHPQTNDITFYNHEIIGSRVAQRIARRLRLSKTDCDRVFTLVRYHMFHYQPHNTDAAIRRFMRKVGLDNIDDILDLREADRLGSGARKTSWRLEEMKQRMVEQLHQPMAVKDLAINGHDLMETFNLKPGPVLGQLLQALFELVLDNPDLNTKRVLLKRAQQLLQTQK